MPNKHHPKGHTSVCFLSSKDTSDSELLWQCSCSLYPFATCISDIPHSVSCYSPKPLAALSVYLSSTMSYWCPPLSDGLSSLCLSVNLHRLKDVPHPYLCNPAAFILPFLLPFLLPLVSLSGPFACPCAVRTHFSDPGTFLGPCWSYLPINRHLGPDRTACQNQLEYWSGLLREVAWWLYLAHLTLLATQALGCEIEAV